MTLPAKTPVEVEARGLRRRFRHSTRYGPMYFLEVEVDRELWEAVEGIPDAALLGGILYWHDGDPTGEEKPADAEPEAIDDPFDGVVDGPALPLPKPESVPKERGRWAKYWQRMYAKGFDTFPELLKELHVNGMGDSVKVALRSRFHCPSLTMVSPDMFVRWVAQKRLPKGLIEKSERAVEELGGTAYKWGDKTRQRGDDPDERTAA